MNALSVYDSEGHQIHPRGSEGSETRYSNYFGTVHLVGEFGAKRPFIECYARVRTERRKEQVFIRYEGETSDRFLEAFRSRVRSELANGRGWTFPDRAQSDPATLFQSLVWTSETLSIPSLDASVLGDHRSTIEAMLMDETDPLRIRGRNFSILAGLVETYRDAGCSIAVVDGADVDAAADLVLEKAALVDAIEVPDPTKQTIEEYERQRARERRQQQFQRIDDALATLARSDTDQQTITRELQYRVPRYFPDIDVVGPETVRRAGGANSGRRRPEQTDSRAIRTDGSSGETAPTSGLMRRVDQLRPAWLGYRRLIAGVVLLVLAILGIALGSGALLDVIGDFVPLSNWNSSPASALSILSLVVIPLPRPSTSRCQSRTDTKATATGRYP